MACVSQDSLNMSLLLQASNPIAWECRRKVLYKGFIGDFPGGPMDKNLPADSGDTGSVPGPGRSHVPWSN